MVATRPLSEGPLSGSGGITNAKASETLEFALTSGKITLGTISFGYAF